MLARLCYGLVFCVAVPALLAAWARGLDAKLTALPQLQSIPLGALLSLGGAALLGRAVWDLRRTGGGLPMNAFPPPRFVASGAYRWVTHPIYAGFGLIVPGIALATGNAAGLWIVTPVTWLAMVALVLGYERIDLSKRFGRITPAARFSLPPHGADNPSMGACSAAAIVAFLPWLLGYEACVLLLAGRNEVNTMLPFERSWPVAEWTAELYLGGYLWTVLAPFAADRVGDLRRFVRTAWCGTAFILWCFLTLPFMADARPLDLGSVAGRLLQADRSIDSAACAFPSFHVFWAFAAAELWSRRIGGTAARFIAVLVAVSCITTGAHSLADVFAGWIVYLAASRCDLVWSALRAGSERIANSWRDWRAGPVRLINHGGYVAAAAALGLWLVGGLLGPAHTPAIITVALFSLMGAGAWGQWLEASSQLSRPFGYFGGLFGGCLGVVVGQLCWGEGWLLAGAFAVAAPVIQAVGRLRCLVQGCCHGRPVDTAWLGIRYTQPLSRVCQLAQLGGVPVHATPLYSILGNVLILGLLLRLWREGADLAFITGAYLILSTCARFIEEGYRGEPQTVRRAGLPIYQWLAIGGLLAGVGLTTLAAPSAPAPDGWTLAPLAYAVPIGLLVWAAMGLDFPDSNRRMSRLA